MPKLFFTFTLKTSISVPFATLFLTQPLIVGSVYRPTDNNLEYTEDLCNAVSYIGRTYKNSTIWIGGDFNLPDIDWKTNSIVSHNYLIPINKSILDMIQDLGAEQMVDFPTRKDNILDICIFVTNRPSLVNKCNPIPGLGYHDIVLIDANIVPTRQKPTRRLIYLWKKANLTEMEQDIAGFSRSFTSDFSETTPINTLWATFKKKCMEVLQKYVPSKYTSTRYSQSWCNRTIRRLSRRKRRAYRKARRTNNDKDWAHFKSLQKTNKKGCKKAHDNYVNTMVSEGGNKEKLYSFVKNKKMWQFWCSVAKEGWQHSWRRQGESRSSQQPVFICVHRRKWLTNSKPRYQHYPRCPQHPSRQE